MATFIVLLSVFLMRDLCADCILKPSTQYRTYFRSEHLTVQKLICGLKILILSWSGLQIQTNRTLPNIPKVGYDSPLPPSHLYLRVQGKGQCRPGPCADRAEGLCRPVCHRQPPDGEGGRELRHPDLNRRRLADSVINKTATSAGLSIRRHTQTHFVWKSVSTIRMIRLWSNIRYLRPRLCRTALRHETCLRNSNPHL